MGNLESLLFLQKVKNKSDRWVELSILKEGLIEELETLSKEIHEIEILSIPENYKNILSNEIEQRKKQIAHFLSRTLHDIEIESKTAQKGKLKLKT